MTIATGTLESAYAKVESAYGTLATPASTDAIRHNALTLEAKLNREASPTKRATPGIASMLPRRKTASWNLPASLWEPSGTLGTASYFGALLKAGFGTQTTPNLATTIASGASATGATLTSGTGLAVGDCAVVTLASAARREVTRLKTVAGAVVTFDAVSASPDTPGAVVSGVNYKLATQITESLSVFLFHTDGGGLKEAVKGALVNQIEMTFDGSTEARIAFSGPAADLVRTGFSLPGAHTTTGSPASGLVGNLYRDGNAFLVHRAMFRLNNGLALRNMELGTSIATGYFRSSQKREVTCEITYYLEDAALITASEALTTAVVRCLVGSTNGAMLGAVAPKVEWEIPTIPDSDGEKIITQTGRCLETSGNDELFATEA